MQIFNFQFCLFICQVPWPKDSKGTFAVFEWKCHLLTTSLNTRKV